MPRQARFGREHGLLSAAFQRQSDDAFRFGSGIDVGSIHEIDAAIQCGMNNANGGLLVRPFAEGIGAQPDGRYAQAAVSETSILHGYRSFLCQRLYSRL
ncbi:hypothetical protein D1872_303560 [compost metagenome]